LTRIFYFLRATLTDVIGRRKLVVYGLTLGNQELRSSLQFLYHAGHKAPADRKSCGLHFRSSPPCLFRPRRLRCICEMVRSCARWCRAPLSHLATVYLSLSP